MNLVNRYITNNPYFNDGKWLTGAAFKGFFLHSVGCAQPNPVVFINGWDKATYTNAGINGFIGADAVYITAQCLETPGKVKRMPHAGSPANNNYIGFEMCEPASLSYSAGGKFTCSDVAGAKAFCEKTYRNAVELFAKLCKFHGKDPLADGVILSHKEGAKRGIATAHGDPEHLWSGLGLPYTMDGFRKDVKEFMEGDVLTTMTKEELTALIKQTVSTELAGLTGKIDDLVSVKLGDVNSKIDARISAALQGKDVEVRPSLKKEFSEAKDRGITDGTRPGGYARRDEVAAMVLRIIKI